MKDSGIEWIGEIPEDWEIRKVKDVFLRKKSEAKEDYPIVLSLARDGIKIRDILNNEGQLAESYYKYNPVEVGDFLINPMDLYSGANCNVSMVSGVISPAYVNLKAKNGNSSRFFDYYFKTQYWSMALFAHGKGVSYENRWTLNNETLMNYSMPYPKPKEQQAIANFLDQKVSEIDHILEKTRESIEEYKKYKQSLITEAVTKGLNPDVEMKDSGIEWIGEIPRHWEVKPCKYVANLNTGKTPPTTISRYFNGDITWYKPGDFNADFRLNDSQDKLTTEAINDRAVELNPENTVYFVGVGATVGKIGYSKNKAFCNQQVTALVAKQINSEFLLYLMQSANVYIQNNALYTTLPIINNGYLGSIKFSIPPLIEQIDIVKYINCKLDEINSLISQKETLLSDLETYKKSLIYECVTGKREVD